MIHYVTKGQKIYVEASGSSQRREITS